MRQALWLAVGHRGAACVVLRVDYHRWRRLARPPCCVSAACCSRSCSCPGVGRRRSTAPRAGSATGPFSLQPSELAKLTVLLFVADLLARRAAWMDDTRAHARARSPSCSAAMASLADAAAEPRHHDRARRHRAVAAASWPARRSCRSPGWPSAGAGRRHGPGALARRTGGPGCSPSSTRGPTTRTPATRTSSRWSASASGGITGDGPRREPGQVGLPARTPTPTSSSPSSARSSA